MGTILKEVLRFRESNPKPEVLSEYFKEILRHNPVAIRYSKDKPYIYYETMIVDEEESKVMEAAEDDIYYVVRNSDLQDIEEMAPIREDKPSLEKVILNIFNYINSRGMYVTHTLCGSKRFLRVEGLSITKIGDTDHFLGSKIYENSELQADSFIACGSYSKNADFRDIKLCVKGSLSDP